MWVGWGGGCVCGGGGAALDGLVQKGGDILLLVAVGGSKNQHTVLEGEGNHVTVT